MGYTQHMSTVAIDISGLSTEERLKLLERVWDSLADSPETVPLTNAQRNELDRRLDDLENEGPVGIPWEQVLKRIAGRSE